MAFSLVPTVEVLYHLLLTPTLLVIFGRPTKGEIWSYVPQYKPTVEYLLFGVNALVQFFFNANFLSRKRAGKYPLRIQVLSALTGIATVAILMVLLRPTILCDVPAFIFCAIALGIYAEPLYLVACKGTTSHSLEWHCLVVSPLITVSVLMLSCGACSLDNPETWKFFPTPLFYMHPCATVLGDLYRSAYFTVHSHMNASFLD